VTAEQESRIVALLRENHMSREAIAQEVGVTPAAVSALTSLSELDVHAGLLERDLEFEHEAQPSGVTFGLERDLQAALRGNIEQLEAGLRVVDGGVERTTDTGRIDITARDDRGALVVIELKAGTAAPEALTQLLAYMGAVGDEGDEEGVRGILVAGGFGPRVVYAAKASPRVQLRRYRFEFTFESI
jgi:RecB family endonuclease NucS